MLSKQNGKILVYVLVILLLVLGIFPPASARADASFIKLVLGGEGATSWSITNIKPGESGNKTVTLTNAGNVDGFVTIWISSMTGVNATGPVKLANYLTLSAANPHLETNLSLPVLMKNFPQSSGGSGYIRINPIPAGNTTTLVWKWELPYQTGNDAQGMGISFTINYLLEDLSALPQPPPAPAPPPAPEPPPETTPPARPAQPPPTTTHVLEWSVEGSKVEVKIAADGRILQQTRLSDSAGNLVVDIAEDTRITTVDGKPLERLELIPINEWVGNLITIPPGMTPVSQAYEIVGFSEGKEVSGIRFNPFVVITINYDVFRLPENALPPFIVTFDKGRILTRLETPKDGPIEAGKAKGIVYHASYFAVMAEAAPPPVMPASFSISNLKIDPASALLGRSITVSVRVTNTGSVTGTSQLYLMIDGIVRSIKEVTVEPNSVVTIEFEVTNMTAGKHIVKIADQNGSFQIEEEQAVPVASLVNWSLFDSIVIATIVAGLIAAYMVFRWLRKKEPINPSLR